MMSGRMDAAGTEVNKLKSQLMADKIILEQQETSSVPTRAHIPRMRSPDLESNPKNYLPRQTGAGVHRHEEANCRLLTMGWDSEGDLL